MIQGKDLLVDIYHAGTRDVENTNQTLGSEMSVWNIQNLTFFSVINQAHLYIFECMEKVHLRHTGRWLEGREDSKIISVFLICCPKN